ncbi:MAG TPA: FkbM family methyltransferase [Flavisolibacter sp.]|nr:FkbM family methyltransferase [Flavisolibacter sp.]
MKLFARKKKESSSLKEIVTNNIEKIKNLPIGTRGSFPLYGKRFNFHDANSFYFSYLEIIKDEIYKFRSTTEAPLIIDCGANMGVSVLFFSKEFPQARIIAFEPEEAIYEVLQKNMETYGLHNVEIHKKAVWDSESVLSFSTDHAMGGSVTNTFSNEVPVKVQTVRLADYLQEPVEFLKLDIEGAEYTVLKDCEPLLKNVQKVFVEYHSFFNKEQKLEEILAMLKRAGFRYHLKQSFSQQRPFVDKIISCENMDMAITVFAYREVSV